MRVVKLEASGIIATSGNPAAEREMTITCHAPPGHYTILCAPYMGGDEGPFRLTIRSNWPCSHSQLWPPEWKKQGLEGPKQSMKQKLVAGAKAKAEAIAQKAKEKSKELKAKAKASIMKNTDWVDAEGEKKKEEAEIEKKKLAKELEDGKEDPNETKLKKAKKMKSEWREKNSADGQYWYNKVTSVSTYEKPEGFLNKKEIRMLEMQVDQERTRRRVERSSRRGNGGNAGGNPEGFNESSDDD